MIWTGRPEQERVILGRTHLPGEQGHGLCGAPFRLPCDRCGVVLLSGCAIRRAFAQASDACADCARLIAVPFPEERILWDGNLRAEIYG